MSWEGSYQTLCKNGHYHESNAFMEEPMNCPYCGEPPDWFNMVDETNGCTDRGDGRCECGKIDMARFLKEPITVHTCSECKMPHTMPPLYNIPTDTLPHKVQ